MAIAREFARPNRPTFRGFIRTLRLLKPKTGKKQCMNCVSTPETDELVTVPARRVSEGPAFPTRRVSEGLALPQFARRINSR